MTTTPTCMTTALSTDALKQRAQNLGLHGLVAHWEKAAHEPWVACLIGWEEDERHKRSLERRLANAKVGRFKTMADFDWQWPTKIDREQIEDLFEMTWIGEGINPIFVGPNSAGKTMIAQNIAYQAVLKGFSVRYTTASALLNDLAACNGSHSLQRRLRSYLAPALLVIDELGYLSYDNRYADLLFEVVSQRKNKSIVLTTNKPFAEWNTLFDNATCVVTLIDRLVHRSEIIQIDAPSYRLKEAQELAASRVKQRRARKSKSKAA